MNDKLQPSNFAELARQASLQLGSHYAFAAAFGVVAVWAVTGPLFAYSDTWQLVINTGTTIVTSFAVATLSARIWIEAPIGCNTAPLKARRSSAVPPPPDWGIRRSTEKGALHFVTLIGWPYYWM
jgi:hypothetical protein